MKLDMDCVRDMLLCVEENTGLRKSCFFIDEGLAGPAKWTGEIQSPPEYQIPLMARHGIDKLIYHLRYCADAGLIVIGAGGKDQYKIIVADLTVYGHEFLSKIRDSKNWSKTKELGLKVGAFGLDMTSKIAEGIATAYLKQQLGLP